MSSKKNNSTLMNILRGNNYWNKKTYGDISEEVGETKDYIKSGTAYTDEAAQKIRAGYAADGSKAKVSAVASASADNGGNPDSYALSQGDKADISYRSAGEDAVRKRAASSEGGLLNSDQNLISAFGTAAGANSSDLATGMAYNNALANTELDVKKVELDYKANSENNASAEKIAGMGYDQQDDNNASAERIAGVENPGTGTKSGVTDQAEVTSEKEDASESSETDEESDTSETNNSTVMNILRGNNYWNKKTYGDISDEVGDTKDYMKSGTAYTDDAAQAIRGSFATEVGTGENTYGANQKSRASGAYGAAAENAVLQRAAQTESNLTASDKQLLEAFKTASGANSTDLATGMSYNANLANTEAEDEKAELDYKTNSDNNASAEKIADMGYAQEDDNNASAERIAEATKKEEEKAVVNNDTGAGVKEDDDPVKENEEVPTTGELLFAYYNYLSENDADPEKTVELLAKELDLDDESKKSLQDAIEGDLKVYKDNTGILTSPVDLVGKWRLLMKPQDFYVALAEGDTDKTLGKSTYEEYVSAYKNLDNWWE